MPIWRDISDSEDAQDCLGFRGLRCLDMFFRGLILDVLFFSCLEIFRMILPLHCFYVDSQEGMTDAQQTYVASVGNEIYRRAGYLA